MMPYSWAGKASSAGRPALNSSRACPKPCTPRTQRKHGAARATTWQRGALQWRGAHLVHRTDDLRHVQVWVATSVELRGIARLEVPHTLAVVVHGELVRDAAQVVG